MPDILHDFPIFAPIDRVFAAVSEPGGLEILKRHLEHGETVAYEHRLEV